MGTSIKWVEQSHSSLNSIATDISDIHIGINYGYMGDKRDGKDVYTYCVTYRYHPFSYTEYMYGLPLKDIQEIAVRKLVNILKQWKRTAKECNLVFEQLITELS